MTMKQRRNAQYDPVALKHALALFDASATAGRHDTADFPDLPDLAPAPVDGEDTLVVLVPRRTS